MSSQNILVIDDEPDILELLELTLTRMGHHTRSAANSREALALLESQDFDLCLTDMRLPDGSGIDIVSHIQQHHSSLPVAVITAHGNMEDAVNALKCGAFDFVSKPVDLKVLRGLVESALRLSGSKENADPSTILGISDVIEELRRTIDKLARSQAPVYIHGESGTGKELAARLIHSRGPRSSQPFIAVNCGAIPTELMESEFFGHIKGSFTGASGDKKGLFDAANGGTLFLDEVADLPLSMQVKLLRAIQERAVKPVGASEEHPIDIRILCATHKELAVEVAEGRFRQDLYYRLNVIELDIPPLRHRREDIPLLANHLLQTIATRWESSPKVLSREAILALQNHDFPGNVRELENILERSVTLSDSNLIDAPDLALPNTAAKNTGKTVSSVEPLQLQESLANEERKAIEAALGETRWNRTAAAKKLGLTLRQLRYRLKKLEIE
ncbi:MAG: sigma-54-dependent transcriptional regulator [bacterium]